MQSHPLRRTPFDQYKVLPAVLGWSGDGETAISCTECSEAAGLIHITGHAHIWLFNFSKYTLYHAWTNSLDRYVTLGYMTHLIIEIEGDWPTAGQPYTYSVLSMLIQRHSLFIDGEQSSVQQSIAMLYINYVHTHPLTVWFCSSDFRGPLVYMPHPVQRLYHFPTWSPPSHHPLSTSWVWYHHHCYLCFLPGW